MRVNISIDAEGSPEEIEGLIKTQYPMIIREFPKESSYCKVHDTYPEPGEPCWACANPFIQKAYKTGVDDGEANAIKIFGPVYERAKKVAWFCYDENDNWVGTEAIRSSGKFVELMSNLRNSITRIAAHADSKTIPTKNN